MRFTDSRLAEATDQFDSDCLGRLRRRLGERCPLSGMRAFTSMLAAVQSLNALIEAAPTDALRQAWTSRAQRLVDETCRDVERVAEIESTRHSCRGAIAELERHLDLDDGIDHDFDDGGST